MSEEEKKGDKPAPGPNNTPDNDDTDEDPAKPGAEVAGNGADATSQGDSANAIKDENATEGKASGATGTDKKPIQCANDAKEAPHKCENDREIKNRPWKNNCTECESNGNEYIYCSKCAHRPICPMCGNEDHYRVPTEM